MPKVGKKHFPYTKKGRKDAAEARSSGRYNVPGSYKAENDPATGYRAGRLGQMTKRAKQDIKKLKGRAKKIGKRLPNNPYYDLGG